MRRVLLVLVVGVLGVAPAAPSHSDTGPVVSVSVTGAGVALRPAFDPAVARYSLGTDGSTAGAVTVDARTTDPAGTVSVDGRPAHGPVQLTGLESGDEISVIVDDATGHHAYALVYLPADFPVITTPIDAGAPQDGLTLVTFGHFAAALDRNGVPARFREFDRAAADFKPAPHGHFTVMVQTAANGGTYGDWDLLELDAQLQTIASYRTVDGLTNTDSHDSILEPDGTRYFVAYEPNGAGRTDPVIQEVAPDGHAVSTWNAADHLDPAAMTTANTAAAPVPDDWAHINSIQVLANGDVLASFRHLSSVLRIAWTAHDGYQRGDVIWRFGGRHSDFTFPDDAYAGPCAQHAAQILADGDLLVWDNGSAAVGPNPSYCVDPADPTGPTVNRPFTRVAEYSLDTGTMTAHLVSSWSDGTRFAYYAGSAYRIGGGDTLVDWAGEKSALVSEYDANGDVVWELAAPSTWSYRAYRADVPDTEAPQVSVTLPGSAVYDEGVSVVPTVSCTDAGGSSLDSCDVGSLTTDVPGAHVLTVTATDGAGLTTTVERSYTVRSGTPLTSVWHAGWHRTATLHLGRRGTVRSVPVRIANGGGVVRRYRLRAGATSATYRLAYRFGDRDITRAVVGGTWLTPSVAPGHSVRVTVVVTRRATTAAGRTVRLTASVPGLAGTASSVSLVLRAR